jgi:hypothetical protein
MGDKMDGMMKRRPMLLLEMLIAFLIMSGVIAFLFAGFFDAIKARNLVKTEKEKILSDERLRLKFYTLFRNIIDIKPLENNSYRLKYNGGIDPEPAFHNTELEAVLTLKNKSLELVTYSPDKDTPPRKELLSEHVDSLGFEFFDKKTGGFTSDFPKHKPCMMRVFINQKPMPLFL